MSKLIDKLNAVSQVTAAAIGFRRVEAEEKKLSLLVMANVTGCNEDEVREIAVSGVSAVVIDSEGLSEGALLRMIKQCSGLITGLVIDDNKEDSIVKAADEDIDFVIFETQLPVSLYGGKNLEKAGRIVKLDMGMDISRLRAVNGLQPPIDAVLIHLAASPLTVDDLMNCRRIADHTGQPLIASVNKLLGEEELVALREAGVKCLLMSAGMSVDDMKILINSISSLPKPVRKKEKDRGSVSLLPHISFPASRKDEGDDTEGDE